VAEEYRTDLCAAERQAKVAALAGFDGIDGQAAGNSGCLR
jgi:hypothetical protein